jgi:succinate dehydrogenase / fumarate reductase membrane anchor subunit
MITVKRHATLRPNLETQAWKYMRLSAILLVPLVWMHAIITTLIVGSENISFDLVAMRWGNIGWRVYDILLLIFAFSHGVTGLRQILNDFTSSPISRRTLDILMLFYWLILSIIGATGIIGGIE